MLKHVNEAADKMNAVHYLTRPPQVAEEYYYEEDAYAVHDQMGGF